MLTDHTGQVIPLHRNDVDIDQIIPARHCKRRSGYQDVLFEQWREDPRFVLNRHDSADATILLGAHNFGTGGPREHAVWALRDWGFKAVIATSFGDSFRRNAWKNGLMAIELPQDAVTALTIMVDDGSLREITADLVAKEIRAGELRYDFAVDARVRLHLIKGLDDIGLTLEQDAAIAAYEGARPSWLPQARRGTTRHAAETALTGVR